MDPLVLSYIIPSIGCYPDTMTKHLFEGAVEMPTWDETSRNGCHTLLECNSRIPPGYHILPFLWPFLGQLWYMGTEGVEVGVALHSIITCEELKEFVPPIPLAPALGICVQPYCLLMRTSPGWSHCRRRLNHYLSFVHFRQFYLLFWSAGPLCLRVCGEDYKTLQASWVQHVLSWPYHLFS